MSGRERYHLRRLRFAARHYPRRVRKAIAAGFGDSMVTWAPPSAGEWVSRNDSLDSFKFRFGWGVR